jgi:hypothetical protein
MNESAQKCPIPYGVFTEIVTFPFLCKFNYDRIDAELVRAGVKAQFVRAERASDGGVTLKVLPQLARVPDIVDPFLEAPDAMRREADAGYFLQPTPDRGRGLQGRGRQNAEGCRCPRPLGRLSRRDPSP